MFARSFLLSSAVVSLLATASVSASTLQLPTGKWEIRTETTNPMVSQPQVETEFECIEDGSFDPTTEFMEEGQCVVTEKEESENKVAWAFECSGQGMPSSSGIGNFQVNGKTATGEMKISMSMGGQTMKMSTRWEARHISKHCD